MTKPSKTQAAENHSTTPGLSLLNPVMDAQMKAFSAWGAGMLQFFTTRLAQDLEAQKAMLACKSLPDIQKVQTAYVTQAIADYQAQMQRSMDVWSDGAKNPMGDMFQPSKRAYDDVPL